MADEVIFYGTVNELLALLSGKSDADLDRAALVLAKVEHPDLEPEPFLALLDSYAIELSGRLEENSSGFEYVAAANEFLFAELGFAGNVNDYYDPHNSCLNDVLTERTGIPISLSVVYLEIARRLAKPVYGIGLPGHFVVQYNDGLFSAYIDPFHSGKLLSAEDCCLLAQSMSGVDVSRNPAYLRPVSKRQIVFRMLDNLRNVYFSRKAYPKALEVLNLILTARPDSAEDYKQRAAVKLHLEQYRGGREDLERYLCLAPAATDREHIQKQITNIKRYLAGMN
jgi:regulator of sirC expression with transglutaminase-like and TPR domain